jgi:hypothetical protein
LPTDFQGLSFTSPQAPFDAFTTLMQLYDYSEMQNARDSQTDAGIFD